MALGEVLAAWRGTKVISRVCRTHRASLRWLCAQLKPPMFARLFRLALWAVGIARPVLLLSEPSAAPGGAEPTPLRDGPRRYRG